MVVVPVNMNLEIYLTLFQIDNDVSNLNTTIKSGDIY